ncbi:MAG TPA: hypothetical protein VIV15_11235, partial [Anaerolineales bacterium]
LARLEVRDADPARAELEARQMASRLLGWIDTEDRRATTLIGPAPCYFSRQAGLYRWQIIVRSPDPASLLRGRVPAHFRLEMDPQSLL